ncbi:MAG: hypothetical protein QF903_10670 [Planctomycetota bacterium]|jgi:hypothetical protein|nr:hypothetical protein [Planctomycetota bacterium]MDP6761352.1 hypothetical protein [Planctomycetota bacterium]MDP6989931.1 hypothetical protein [Planctomycetota bacterium]
MSPLDPELDPFQRMEEVSTYPLASRRSLVGVEDFCAVPEPVEGFEGFFDSLPDIYAGTWLKELVERIVAARLADRPVAVALGAHVLKVGLAPLVIDLMRRGVIDHVATNGAGAIHDFEIATCGRTSEDVAEQLPRGEFGFAEETGAALARAAELGCRPPGGAEAGFGRGLGRLVAESGAPHADLSVCAEAFRLGIGVTVHACIGSDIVHMHPAADGAAIGEASMIDFRHLCRYVSDLDGGVWINVGCAVVLPEAFLKAVSVAINLGTDLSNMTTANLDMLRQYRAETNVVQRPPGRGLSILGQHEILLPLLRMAVLSKLASAGWEGAAR